MSQKFKLLLIISFCLIIVCICLFTWLSSSSGGEESQRKVRSLRLNNGLPIPVIGLGTWTMDDSVASRAIREAVELGYRHIDTAWRYQNELGIGMALSHLFANNIIRREDVFVTSKVWNTYHSRERAVLAIKKSLRNLQLDYLDLALVHWPTGFKSDDDNMYPKYPNGSIIPSDNDIADTWKGMEDAYRAGLAKSIGVSNFNAKQIEKLMKESSIKPAINQFEIHPFLSQSALVSYCQSMNITVTAYSPLRQADRKLLENPVLNRIGSKYGKSAAQVALRWLNQRNIVAIPKSARKEHMTENSDIFDFELTDQDMTDINALNSNQRLIDIPGIQTHADYPFV